MAEKEYIERETLLDRIRGTGYAEPIKSNLLVMAVTIPAADVRFVVRGKWVESFPLEVECDRCKFRVKSLLKIWYKFCPNCGADMREES